MNKMSLIGCWTFVSHEKTKWFSKSDLVLRIRGPIPSPHRSFTTAAIRATLEGKKEVPLGTGSLVLARSDEGTKGWWFVSNTCAHPVVGTWEVISLQSPLPELGSDKRFIVNIEAQKLTSNVKLADLMQQDGITDPDVVGRVMDLGYSVFSFMNPDWYSYLPNHYIVKAMDASGQHLGLWKIITDDNNMVISAVFWHHMRW